MDRIPFLVLGRVVELRLIVAVTLSRTETLNVFGRRRIFCGACMQGLKLYIILPKEVLVVPKPL